MAKKKRARPGARPSENDLRLNPQDRLSAKFDSGSVAKYPVSPPGEMGMRVRDNCAEENIK